MAGEPGSAGDPPGWKVVALDDVEAVPWLGGELQWRPLRQALGTRIVGMAAYTATRAGQEVVEAHAESAGGRGHEEVYVVLRGRALFTLDGATSPRRCWPPGGATRTAPARS